MTRLRTMLRAAGVVAVLVGASACSDTAEPVPTTNACTAMVETCRTDQMACVVGADGPSCQPCDVGTAVDKAGTCQAIEGTALSHEFPETTTPSGGEILGLCRSWTLNNDEELWVNAVELSQNEFSHHSNWTFVPEEDFDGPDGAWPCKDRDYNQLSAALAGGVLYAQSTQATHEVQQFPEGVAIRIPPRSRIISDIHTLNTTSEAVTGSSSLTIYTIGLNEVSVKLVPFHVTYDGLNIPPQSTSRFTGECELDSWFQDLTGAGLDMQLYYLLPHTHALGTRMFVETIGGPEDGTSLIDVRGFNGEARGRYYDPPVDLGGSTGLRFGCEFYNPREESVGWGFDDQEMCEALGFAASPVAFESRVETAEADGMDEDIAKFTGECGTIAFPWNHNK